MFTSVIHRGKNNSKIRQITVNDKKLITPTYFPSISGLETRSDADKLIREIIAEHYPRLLVSCYDLDKFPDETKRDIINRLNNFSDDGGFLMLDSGEFERYHLKSTWCFDEYQNTIKKVKSDFYFSFDKIPNLETPYEEILETTIHYFPLSSALSKNNHCITVLHGVGVENIQMLTEYMITNYADLNFIAITDKECGKTLQEQCITISAIRDTCDKKGRDVIIHVLGCGNPLSMAAMSYAGADMFDAVDWSRWIIDNKTWQCSNLSHVKLLDCTCIACSDHLLPNEKIRAFQHNLIFYQDFMSRLQNAISRDVEFASFLTSENIDQNVIDILSKIF